MRSALLSFTLLVACASRSAPAREPTPTDTPWCLRLTVRGLGGVMGCVEDEDKCELVRGKIRESGGLGGVVEVGGCWEVLDG